MLQKRALFLFFLIWTAGFAVAQVDTLKARVAVLPLENAIGDAQYDVIGGTIADTIELTLKLLGLYTVVELEAPSGQLSVETLKEFARANRLDNVIFGNTSREADGTIVFDVSVYDRVEDKVILDHQETATTFFDTFDAADAMVVSIVESFSDTHIGWGTIVLSNEGARGNFDIYIDGTYFGSSRKSLPNILIGPRKITLKQDRPFGEVIIAEEVIQVAEDETSVMTFSIDSVTPMENSGFGAIEQAIRNAWQSGDETQVEQQFALAFTLLEKASASSGLEELKDRYSRWFQDFRNGVVPEEWSDLDIAAAGPAAEAAGAGSDAEEKEQEPVEAQPGETPEPAKEKRGKTIVGAALLTSGVLSLAQGNLFSLMSAEYRYQSLESWDSYVNGSEKLSDLYGEYSRDIRNYQAFGIINYALSGAGALMLSTSLFILPEHVLTISKGGRLAASIGVVTGVAGNVFLLLANNQRFANLALFDEYYGASNAIDATYTAYETGASRYRTFRILSFSLWGAGALAGAGALFLPGSERTPVAATSWDKVLLSSGLYMLAGGNFTAAMANNYLLLSDAAWQEYEGAASSFDTLYADYLSMTKRYTLTSVLSYGLWAAGSAAILTSLIVRFRGRGAAVPVKKRPSELSIMPVPSGISVTIKRSGL